MSVQAKITWAGACLSALMFVVLAVMSKFWLEPGGQLIFDSRVLGYEAETAWHYLRSLTDDQTALYLGPFRILDTIFPIVLGATLASVIWMQSIVFSSLFLKLLIILPVAYVAADLAENALVAVLLHNGTSSAVWEIALASIATQVKWGALLVTVIICVSLWVLGKRQTLK